jgi:cyclohexanone monooxygenase
MTATGFLSQPRLPDIEGVDDFAGSVIHTAQWDDAADLSGKRVAVIGTGATAVQCVPHLARAARELYVFQRTPSSIDVRANEPTDPEWFERDVLSPGWQQRWLDNFCTLQTGGFAEEDLVRDGWTDISRRIRDKVVRNLEAGGEFTMDLIDQAFDESDLEKMTEIRRRVEQLVDDPDTAESLKPWYRQLCKRPCFHDEYLQAFNQPGVRLIDTDGKGVERITPTGVVVDGVEHEVDCIIYASGFEVGTDHVRRSGFEVTGRDGTTLTERWSEGMRSLHGIHVHRFPNLFVIGAAQGGNLISNYPHNLSEAATAVAAVIAHAEARSVTEVEVTSEAEEAWIELLLGAGPRRVGGDLSCTPGYYNNEGQPTGLAGKLNAAGYPQGPVAFFELLDRWRTSGDFEGLELR